MSGPVLVHRVIARLNVGGPAMHVVNLARGLDAVPADRPRDDVGPPGEDTGPGWRTQLICGSVSETEGDMEYYAAARDVEITHIDDMSREISALHDLRTLWALYRIFRRERPTVVHTHTAKAGTLGRLAALLARVPVRIHTFHGHVLGGDYFPPWKTRLFLEIERQLSRVTSRLVVLTREQAREMSDELGVAPAGKFAVVPLGLELDTFASLDRATVRARTRSDLRIPEGVRAVGIVGRMVPIKNHELFLEAFAALRRRHGDGVVAMVIGAGEREAHLKAVAASFGLGEEVRWLGWRQDLPELYAALDVVALTSHDEGTPVALLEALATGTPVVARAVGGVVEVLKDVGAGRVVPREAGAEEWADVLWDVLRDTAGVATRPASGQGPDIRETVATRYSVARLASDIAALYREALAVAVAGAGSAGPDAGRQDDGRQEAVR